MSACGRPGPGWSRVDLADDGQIVVLAPGPTGLLVGRHDRTAATRSSLQSLDTQTGSVRRIPLRHGKGYAAEAQLVSLSATDDRITALGSVRGGAHGNPRWTVWSGDSHGLHEQPQTFETFGGWDAGGLVGSAYGPDGPILIGSWRAQSGAGLDVAVWRVNADRWVRTPVPDPAFRATAQQQPAVSGLAATAERYVAVGSTTLLGTSPRSVPTAWLAYDAEGPWYEIRLPLSTRGTGTARAEAISCAAHHCAIAGRRGQEVLAWRLTLNDQQAPVVGAPVPIGHEVAEDTRIGVAAGNAGHDWVAATDGGTHVINVSPTGATSAFETPGTLTAMSRASDGRPFLAVMTPSGGPQLWQGP